MSSRVDLRLLVVLALAAVLVPARAHATPSTTFWAPSTPYVQGFGVLHATYDTYFGTRSAYPIDVGLTMGILPGKKLQAEVGFDLFYPTVTASGPLDAPFVLHGKVGAPEDAWFQGQPAWSAGIFGVGFEEDVNDQNVLYGMLGRTFPRLGVLQLGGYYALNEDLFRSSSGETERAGVLAGWLSPGIDVPLIDKIVLTWDLQSGENVLGATGGGAYFYFTPAVDLLVGPVFFFEKELQPGGADWMWSVQFDADVDLMPDGE
jgi:hypothetical protein